MNGQPDRSFAAVADQQHGWIGRLPARFRDYAVLARLDRPIGTWLLLIPCWWGLALAEPGWMALWYGLLFAVGAIAMRGAGCTINDMADRRFDAMVERTRARPLASGRLSMRQALGFLALQLLVGALVLIFLPLEAAAVALLSVPLFVIYPFMKRITYWPQAWLGLTFNWGVLVGYAAIAGTVDTAALALYAAGFFWTLGYDTIYAHQDKTDDLIVGVKSTALKLGTATPRWLQGFFTAMLALLVIAGFLAGLSVLYYPALFVPAYLLWRQVEELDIDDPARCLGQFRAHRGVGLVVLGVLLLGAFGPG